MIITISGLPGSGKSTVAKYVAKKLNLKHYYIGQILRDMAKKQGKVFQDFYKEADPEEVDKKVDEYQKKLGIIEDNFIIEGRTSFYFIPHSTKVFLTVDLKVGAKRIFEESKRRKEIGSERTYNSLEEAINDVKDRIETEKKRYWELYHLDHHNLKLYDLVIDSTHLTPTQIGDLIIDYVKNKN